MSNTFLATILLILIPQFSQSQNTDTPLTIEKTDIPDAKFDPPRVFTGPALYGYIDGGAQLYLEYGFTDARIYEINYHGNKYKTEIFRMKGPDEAFGIFSVSRYKCRNSQDFAPYSCQTPYQLQLCSGNYYISIINGTGTKADSTASVIIGRALLKKIGEPSVNISGYLAGDYSIGQINRSAILAKGKLGLANGASEWEDFFSGASGYRVVILPVEDRTILSVTFTGPDDLAGFVRSHGWDLPEKLSEPLKLPDGMIITQLNDKQLLITKPG